MAKTAAQNEVLIEGKSDNVGTPVVDDELDFSAGKRSSGKEAFIVRAGILQSGSIDAAQQDGLAGGEVDDAIAGSAERRE
jgi:hypothetical protein